MSLFFNLCSLSQSTLFSVRTNSLGYCICILDLSMPSFLLKIYSYALFTVCPKLCYAVLFFSWVHASRGHHLRVTWQRPLLVVCIGCHRWAVLRSLHGADDNPRHQAWRHSRLITSSIIASRMVAFGLKLIFTEDKRKLVLFVKPWC